MLKLINSMAELNVRQLLDIYSYEKMGETDFLSYLREDFFRQKGAFYAVWVVDGVYKSALRLEPYRDGMLLQALETAPGERRKGYAFNLMTDVIAYLKTKDCTTIYSHIHKKNIPSLQVHRKCGFREVSDTATLLDGTVTQNFCTMCCEL